MKSSPFEAARGRHFFDVERGEFFCLMCRSVSNCLVPCIADDEFLETPSTWDEATTARRRDAPGLFAGAEGRLKKHLTGFSK